MCSSCCNGGVTTPFSHLERVGAETEIISAKSFCDKPFLSRKAIMRLPMSLLLINPPPENFVQFIVSWAHAQRLSVIACFLLFTALIRIILIKSHEAMNSLSYQFFIRYTRLLE